MSINGDIKVTDKAKQRWIVACAAFATFMGTLDEFIVGISLPTITKHFHTGTSESVWIVIIYFLMVTGTLILFGKLADRKGLKKLFIAGYVVFIAGSLFCGISWNIYVLIAARFLQGIGGSILRVVAYAIVPKFLPSEIRGWGFGILSTASASGIMIGAPAGGFITSFFSWHWIFLVNIPIGILAILVVNGVLPKEETVSDNGTGFDIPGAALSFLSFCTLTYALNMGHERGWGDPVIVSCLIASAGLFVLFIKRELATPDPLLDLSLFRNTRFVFGNIAMFMTCMFMSGDSFLFPFYLQLSRGLTPSAAGLVLLIYSLVYVPASQIAGRLSDRIKPPVLCGFAMLSGTLACLFFVSTMGDSGFWPVYVYIAWAAISCAMFISPSNNNVMSQAPDDKQGSASGILSTANQLSGVIGVCIFEAIFSMSSETAGNSTDGQLAASPSLLLTGFRNAYICAMIVCMTAMIFSFLTKTEEKRQEAAS